MRVHVNERMSSVVHMLIKVGIHMYTTHVNCQTLKVIVHIVTQ